MDLAREIDNEPARIPSPEQERGFKVLFTFPASVRICRHPSGDGWLVADVTEPLKWVHTNGVIEVVKP